MLKTYGRAVIVELDGMRMSIGKVTDGEIRESLEEYRTTV
jgi:hypothetical protein